MANTNKESVILDVVVSSKVGGYNRMVKCGRVFVTDKGTSMINIESTPTMKGNWDGKTYLVMKPDMGDITDVYPVVEGSKGSNLPALELKAIFDVEEGRDTRTNYLLCGAAWHGKKREDGDIRSLVMQIDRLPIGDTGDWDGFTYTGTPVKARTVEQVSRSNKSSRKKTEDEVAEA